MSSPHPRTPGTWRVGRLAGTDILVKPSLLVMGAVLVAIFAPRFAERSESNPYVLAIVFVLALYLSVLVHELAHVAVARAFRMRVQSVTLHLLGGETIIEGESRTPWQELSTSIAGPLASLGIGLVALGGSRGLDEGALADGLYSVGYINLIVAAFNMLPGLPLDGGRVFRAIIWQVTGREVTGVRVAAWIGRIAAVGVVVATLVWREDGNRFISDLVIAALVAWFLWQGATDALRHAGRTSRINSLAARSLVDSTTRPPVGAEPISADLRGAPLLQAMAKHPSDTYAVTEADGTVIGVLTMHAVDDAYRKGLR